MIFLVLGFDWKIIGDIKIKIKYLFYLKIWIGFYKYMLKKINIIGYYIYNGRRWNRCFSY